MNIKEFLKKRIENKHKYIKHYQVILKLLIEQKIEIHLKENIYGEFNLSHIGIIPLFYNEVFSTIDLIRFEFLKTQDAFSIFSTGGDD